MTVTGGAGPYTWSVKTGTLPAGITLNASTGVLAG
ncbi:putative Ig domain-containing protein, partial [Streptomyces sp. RKAG290]